MKAVLHESGTTQYYKSKQPSQARLEKRMKNKLKKKAAKKKHEST